MEVCDMKESLQNIFKSMIESRFHDEAIEFISMTLGQVPDYCVLSAIIYKVLMKTSDKQTAINAWRYLMKFLDIYPPSDHKTRIFYYKALRLRNEVQADLWDVTADIIRSCLSESGVLPCANPEDDDNEEAVLNSDFLLQYIVNVFSIDFEHFSETRFSHARKNNCLLAKLFCPSGEISYMKSNCEELLVWINDVYKHPIDGEKIEILELLHKLLCLVAKFGIWSEDCSDAEAVYCQYLDQLAQIVCRFCGDVWKSSEKLKLFLSRISLKWLRIKICENLIYKTLYPTGLPYGKTAPLTLRKIIRVYMFPSHCKKGNPKMHNPRNYSKFEATPKSSKLNILKKNSRGKTILHIACKTDKPGTLAQHMGNKDIDVNVRDNFGSTPLHEACWSQTYFCAHVLCTGIGINGNQKADLKAADDDGLTPLHCAVSLNDFNIAKLLLENGGLDILNLKNKDGKTPGDLAKTTEMKQVFEEYKNKQSYLVKAENFYNADIDSTRSVPCFENYEFYSIYLHLLNYLLCDYMDTFQLHKLINVKKKYTLKETVQRHLINKCCYVQLPSTKDILLRCDDILVMEKMPKVIQTFLEELQEQTTQMKLNISILVMPFTLLASAF